METILIFGATGDQGHSLMRQLVAAGYAVRAATRDPAKFDRAAFPGVEPVVADFGDQPALDAAAAGCSGILMHLPFTFDRDYARLMGRNIGLAASRAGIGKIIFHTSCVVMEEDLGIAGHDGRRDIEAELAASGVPYVFIRSAVFMDNMARIWVKPAIVNHGVFAYPCKPDLAIAWIDQEDIAAYMIAAYRHPGLVAHRFTVGGPEALTGSQAAARLSEAIGREVRFQSLDPDDFAGAMSKLVTGSASFEKGSLYDRMAEFYRWYNAQPISPLAIDLRPALAFLAVRPTPLLVWAKAQDWSS